MNRILLALLLLPITTFSQTLAPPTISHASGFYTDSFYVKITHPDPDVTILYTLDGSEPRIENLTGRVWNYKKQYPTNGEALGPLLQDTIWTYEYTDPILVRDRSNEPDRYADISASYYTNYWYNSMAKPDSVNVFKGAGLRVMACKDGVFSKIVTKNYFVSPKGENRYSLPVTCLNVNPELFFSYENGLNVPGLLFDEWRINNPAESIDRIWAPANFRASGSASEITLNYSYLVENNEVLNQGIGLRLHGNGSRFYPNRSYRLYAKSEYGTSKFDYPFFSDYSENSFKRIILRNSGGDTEKTMFRDAFIHQVSKTLHYDIQEYRPSILFINGEYFGLYNIRERFDDKYIEQVYNINGGDLDLIENNGDVEEGDNLSYNLLMNYFNSNSLEDSINYIHATKLIDILNFTDYFVTEIFVGNTDWPQNNNLFWRKRVSYDSNAPYGHDGRWRWLLKDLDQSFGNRDEYPIEYNDLLRVSKLSDTDTVLNKSTLIFRKLLENDSYKNYFINRFCDILNSSYKSELLVSKIMEIKNNIASEMPEHITRWNPQNEQFLVYHPVYSYPIWEKNVDTLIYFANNRSYWMRNHIENRFETGGKVNLILGCAKNEGEIKLNTLEINEYLDGVNDNVYPWSGVYFKNVPVTLKAIAKPGYVFSHWSGEIYDTLQEITLNLDNDTYIKANFVIEDDPLSLNNLLSVTKNITIYPNPFNDKINVLSDVYDGTFTVYSIEGKIVRQNDFSSPVIELEDLSKGIFVIEINTGGHSYRKRIIKQ